MRRLVILLATVGVLVTTLAAQTTSINHEPAVLELRISTDQKSYATGEVIPIHVRLTNVSKRDVFVGRDMWSNASPSGVTVSVTPQDGRAMTGIKWAVDGFTPDPSPKVLPKEVLEWCLLLPPGYSYGSETTVQDFVEQSGLTPGIFKLRAFYVSGGIDAQTYFNPLLAHPEESATLQENDWKGEVASNEVTIRIVTPQHKPNRTQKQHQ